MKSSKIRNFNWPFATFWLIYFVSIFSCAYVILESFRSGTITLSSLLSVG
jgi:hypothetical protein